MKRLMVLVLLCGCKPHAAVHQNVAASTPAPCAPNVTQEINPRVHPAKIIEKSPNKEDWNDTHDTSCAYNERTVLPSMREFEQMPKNMDSSEWEDKHTLCEPDGLK